MKAWHKAAAWVASLAAVSVAVVAITPRSHKMSASFAGPRLDVSGGVSAAGIITMYPSGGDDWPRVMAQAAVSAPLGQAILLSGGTWHANTDELVPSFSRFIGTPQTNIVMGLPNTGIQDDAFAIVSVQGASVNLCVNNVPGTKTLVACGQPGGGWTVGSWVIFSTGVATLHGGLYQIKGVSGFTDGGGSNYTLTTDRAVLYAGLASSAILRPITTLEQGIRIEGNGMTISGTASQAIEVIAAYNILIQDINIDGTLMPSGQTALDFDGYVLDSVLQRMNVNGAGVLGSGVWVLGENNRLIGNTVFGVTGVGFTCGDSAIGVFIGNTAYGNGAAGLQFLSDGAGSGVPTVEGNVIGGFAAYGNAGAGINISDGASNLTISEAMLEYNGNGILLDNTQPLGAPNNVKIVGGSMVHNTGDGIVVLAGAKGTVITNVDVSNNGSNGIDCEDDCTLLGVISGGGVGAATIQIGAGVTTLGGAQLVQNSATSTIFATGSAKLFANNVEGNLAGVGYQPFFKAASTARIAASGVHLTYTQQGIGFQAAGTSVIAISDVTISGANIAGSEGIEVDNGATGRIGKNVHLDAIGGGSAYTATATSFWSRSAIGHGAVTLTGTTPVVVAWPDLQSGDDVLVEYVTGGTTSSPVIVTPTPGTGFTLKGLLSTDNGTVNYVVQ
jgi:parallel beta-helix repeat protein